MTEARGQRFRRRLRTIPIVLIMTVVLIGGSPVWLAVALIVDVVRWAIRRRPWMATRLVLFGIVYSLVELLALFGVLVTWLASGFGRNQNLLSRTAYWLQAAWARTLWRSLVVLLGLDVRVSGSEVASRGPLLLFMRHASIIDVLIPANFVTRPHSILLRYVIKRELLVDPALDIAGNRMPNHFVDRSGGATRRETEAIATLGRQLTDREGVIIYPEGTRFTPEKRARALASLERRTPELLDRARALQHVLPPRPGGPLALLSSGVDTVFLAHTGLEGAAELKDLWSGDLVGRVVQIHMWRVAGSEIPDRPTARMDWLFDQWQRLDDWVAERVGA